MYIVYIFSWTIETIELSGFFYWTLLKMTQRFTGCRLLLQITVLFGTLKICWSESQETPKNSALYIIRNKNHFIYSVLESFYYKNSLLRIPVSRVRIPKKQYVESLPLRYFEAVVNFWWHMIFWRCIAYIILQM